MNLDMFKCGCTYSKTDLKEGKIGCGILCLNRMLNIEW